MTINLSELRKVAEAATPGPWSTVDAHVVQVPNFPDGHWVVDCPNPSEVDHINAEFIATFDPPTVLVLLSRLEQAEQAVQRVRVELGYIPEDFSARIYKALDGDTRRLADQGLGGGERG